MVPSSLKTAAISECSISVGVGDPRVGRPILAAPVPMPGAAVDEIGGFVFGQENVHGNGSRRARFPFGWGTGTLTPALSPDGGEGVGWVGEGNAHVQAEAIAESVQQGADDSFRGGVLAADAAHVPRAALAGEAVFAAADTHGNGIQESGFLGDLFRLGADLLTAKNT